MTNPMPPVEYDAPAVNPAGLGLYEAATPVQWTGPTRFLAGVNIRPYNCAEGYGTWPTDPCVDPGAQRKEGDRPEAGTTFMPVQPWAYDECDMGEADEVGAARARQTLRLKEPILVESAFATRILADATALGAIPTRDNFKDALGYLEEELGETGFLGYIHAARRWAAHATGSYWGGAPGAVLKTPLRHSWVFGGGYGSVLGNTLVATGPVYYWRSEENVITGRAENINRKFSVAERTALVGYECIVAAVTITQPAP